MKGGIFGGRVGGLARSGSTDVAGRLPPIGSCSAGFGSAGFSAGFGTQGWQMIFLAPIGGALTGLSPCAIGVHSD